MNNLSGLSDEELESIMDKVLICIKQDTGLYLTQCVSKSEYQKIKEELGDKVRLID